MSKPWNDIGKNALGLLTCGLSYAIFVFVLCVTNLCILIMCNLFYVSPCYYLSKDDRLYLPGDYDITKEGSFSCFMFPQMSDVNLYLVLDVYGVNCQLRSPPLIVC